MDLSQNLAVVNLKTYASSMCPVVRFGFSIAYVVSS